MITRDPANRSLVSRVLVAGACALLVGVAACASRGDPQRRTGMDALTCPTGGERFARVRNYSNGAVELVTRTYGDLHPPSHLALLAPAHAEEFTLADSVLIGARARSATSEQSGGGMSDGPGPMGSLQIDYFCR